MKIVHSLALATVLGIGAFAAPSASAADFGFSVNVGDTCNDGYYDSVWVPPVYRTEYYYGQPRLVIVVPGYYSRVYRPRYYNSYVQNRGYSGGSNYYGSGSYYGSNNYYSNRGTSYSGRGDYRGYDSRNNNTHGRDNNRYDRNDRNDRRH